jgi:hypothetical protein
MSGNASAVLITGGTSGIGHARQPGNSRSLASMFWLWGAMRTGEKDSRKLRGEYNAPSK